MHRIRFIVMFALVALVSLPGVVRADDGCAVLENRWGKGLTRGVAHSAGTVFYGTGSELVAVNASTDAEIGRLELGGVVHAVEVEGGHAFVAGDKLGLIVVDVSDPAQMQVLVHTDEPPAASSVDADGDLVVVADLWQDLWIFDVTNPGAPQRLATFELAGYPVDVDLVADVVVVSEQDNGARVVGLADPSNPTELALLDTAGDVNDVAAVGSNLLVADGGAGLLTVDFADPSNPTALGSLPLPGSATGVAVSGQTAWVAADYGGYYAVDISNMAAPTVVGSSDTSAGTPYDIEVSGSRVWMPTWSAGVALVDGSDRSSPQEIDWYPGAGQSRSVAALGDYAVVADWSGLTLRVLDPNAAGGPAQIGSLAMPGYVRQMAIAANTAYVALEWGDFAIVDLSDPTNPKILGSVTVPGSPQHVALMGDVALVAAKSEGLQVVDITHTDSPSVVGAVAIPESANSVIVSGTTAYVAAGSAGLVVVDVATPSNPQVIGSVDLGAVALHAAVDGDHVFVAAYYSGLFSVDVSDPAHPVQAGHVDPYGTARSVVVSGDLAFVGDSRWGLVIVDVGDPANMAVTGTNGTPGSGYEGAFVGSKFVLADDDAGVAFFDVSGCGQGPEPPHADFSFSPAQPKVGETVSFTDLTTGGPTNWGWWFADDGSTSSEQHPTHVFSSAGAFEVRLQVSSPNGSSTATRTVIVNPAAGEVPPISFPFASTSVIPAAAHVGGAQGTAWVTDIVLHNPRTEPVAAVLFFMKTDVDSSNAQGVEMTVPGNQSHIYTDVVHSLFGEDRGTGAILVGSDRPLTVSSRTYNNLPDGTYGQFIAGNDLNDALMPGGSATVVQLSAGSFRSNLGAANTSGETIDVAAEIYSDAGLLLTTRHMRVPPWSHAQINGVFAAAGYPSTADGYAVMRCGTLNARWFAYASVVDNRSGDPVYVAPVAPISEPLWIAAAARVEGANDTNWRTDLELFRGSPAPDRLTVEWYGIWGGAPTQASLSLSGSPAERVEDVLDTLYSSDGAGALRLVADQGQFAATSRTFNDTGNETYGQYIPAAPESDLLSWGETARLVQLAHSPDRRDGFRTNLGFVNTTAQTTTVMVELRDWDGSVLGVIPVELAPRQYTQLNNVFKDLSDEVLLSPYAVVYTSTGGAGYFAYASVVDNRSGDPIYIPAVREP